MAGDYGISLAATREPSLMKFSCRVPTHELKVGS